MSRVVRVVAGLLPPLLVLAATAFAAVTFGAVVVVSGSMAPAVRPGDVVVYRRGAAPAVSDLAVIEGARWRETVVHRVISRSSSGEVTTRGDANPIPDRDPVPATDVRGRGVLVVRTGRLFSGLAAWARRARLLHQSNSVMR